MSTAARMNGTTPEWKRLKSACFPVRLTDQGLSAENGDVLFSGARFSFSNAPGAPPASTQFFEPPSSKGNGYYITNLSYPVAHF